MLWQEGESVTTVYVTYDEKCCEGFEIAPTIYPCELDLHHYKLELNTIINKYSAERSKTRLKDDLFTKFNLYNAKNWVNDLNNKMIFIDKYHSDLWVKYLLDYLVAHDCQIRTIEKGQARLT